MGNQARFFIFSLFTLLCGTLSYAAPPAAWSWIEVRLGKDSLRATIQNPEAFKPDWRLTHWNKARVFDERLHSNMVNKTLSLLQNLKPTLRKSPPAELLKKTSFATIKTNRGNVEFFQNGSETIARLGDQWANVRTPLIEWFKERPLALWRAHNFVTFHFDDLLAVSTSGPRCAKVHLQREQKGDTELWIDILSKSPSFEASRSLLKIVEMRFLNRFEGRSQRPEILQKQKPICRLQFELANRKETLDVYSDASGGLWVRNTNLPNVQFEVKKELVTKVDSLKAVPATQ